MIAVNAQSDWPRYDSQSQRTRAYMQRRCENDRRMVTLSGCETDLYNLRLDKVAPIAQLAEGLARMQEVSVSNPRLGRLQVSPLQASGGIGTLQSRTSGLQSTTQGNSIGTKKQLRVQQKEKGSNRRASPAGGSADRVRHVRLRAILARVRVAHRFIFPAWWPPCSGVWIQLCDDGSALARLVTVIFVLTFIVLKISESRFQTTIYQNCT